ncbi:MFS transporter [Demequina globuliformis]|uniref:MFS transporter n=1 Tax=Demequina globuliformis TaxID=676202 RepID=UPI0007847685|nr:MFS transporter [Demequina globuliformis]
MSAIRRWAALAVLVSAVLLLAIDSTVLYLAVPSLTADLQASATQVLWIGDIYSLAIAGLLVTMGNVADRVGRKKLLLIGAAGFGMASVLAASATTPEMLIAARLLLGVTGATLMPSTLSLIRTVFPDPTERTRAIAIWSAAAASGLAIGPLVGGVLLEHFWWGSVFLINVPVVLALVAAGAWLLPESRSTATARFDLLSAGLSMAAIIPFVYVVKKAFGADVNAMVIAAAALSAASAVAFVKRQRTSPAPMVDVKLFRVPEFAGAVAVNFISVFALSGVLFFFAQYLQLARGMSPLEAGVAQLPLALASMAVALVVSAALRAWGRGPAIAAGLSVAASGLLLLAFVESAESYWWIALALIPVGLGVGMSETLSVDAVVSAVEPDKAGAASSISETAYELGVAMGIAVLGSVATLAYRLSLDVPPSASPETAATVEDSLAGASAVLEPGDPLLIHAQGAFTQAMQIATVAAAVVLLLGAVVAWRRIPAKRAAVLVDH